MTNNVVSYVPGTSDFPLLTRGRQLKRIPHLHACPLSTPPHCTVLEGHAGSLVSPWVQASPLVSFSHWAPTLASTRILFQISCPKQPDTSTRKWRPTPFMYA